MYICSIVSCSLPQCLALWCNALESVPHAQDVRDRRAHSMFFGKSYRVAKTHRMLQVAGHVSQKSHQLQGSFAENDV